MRQYQRLFAILIVVQAFHSLEEYLFRLWEDFPPAQYLSGLVSSDLELGFIVINASIVILGVICYVWPIRSDWSTARPIAWFWVVLALINGIGHPVWSVIQGGYTPGLLTSLLLLPLSVLLARALLKRS